MGYTMFTAGACPRCKIAKTYMDRHGIDFQEVDLKAGGMEQFREFYAANRGAVRRVGEGVEFPIVTDGQVVKQGVGLVIAHLMAGDRLDGFLRPSDLGKGWIDGLIVSGGAPDRGEQFVELLKTLKAHDLKTQLETDGANAGLLATILNEQLGDRVIMHVDAVPEPGSEAARSLALVPRFPDHAFTTTVTEPDPEPVGRIAERIKETTGSAEHPYTLKARAGLPDRDVLSGLDAAKAHLPSAALERE